MNLRYTIEDLDGLDYTIIFDFYYTCDNQLVYSGAFDVIRIIDENFASVKILPEHDKIIINWLEENEEMIYTAAIRESRL